MRRFLEGQFDKMRPNFEPGGRFAWAWPLWEGNESFALTPGTRTKTGAHVRDPMDVKRLMSIVILALIPATLFGMWNTGNYAFRMEGIEDATHLESLLRGAWHMLPIIITSYVVGGLAEVVFCVVRKHEINEGFLVTGLLFPLVLAPTTPLWMVAAGVLFGVIIGKEVFGGTGMNVLNPALTSRAFLFFTYPAAISGALVWDVVGIENPITRTGEPIDAYTGATPLLAASDPGEGRTALEELAAQGFTFWDMAVGTIPGSMGEVSAIAAFIGALVLIALGIGSWRIMAGCVLGLVGMTLVFNLVAGPASNPLMHLPPHYHLVMGGFAFAAVFMATDPVSASQTNTGRWIYGLFIGVLVGLIRVVNPAYPEGAMLAILFMNVFAPLIDYYVVQASTRRRAERLAAAS